jgi:hypothetical protein
MKLALKQNIQSLTPDHQISVTSLSTYIAESNIAYPMKTFAVGKR